jgi:hypothetical protein
MPWLEVILSGCDVGSNVAGSLPGWGASGVSCLASGLGIAAGSAIGYGQGLYNRATNAFGQGFSNGLASGQSAAGGGGGGGDQQLSTDGPLHRAFDRFKERMDQQSQTPAGGGLGSAFGGTGGGPGNQGGLGITTPASGGANLGGPMGGSVGNQATSSGGSAALNNLLSGNPFQADSQTVQDAADFMDSAVLSKL